MEANFLNTHDAICTSAFVGSPLHRCVPYSQALMSFLQVDTGVLCPSIVSGSIVVLPSAVVQLVECP